MNEIEIVNTTPIINIEPNIVDVDIEIQSTDINIEHFQSDINISDENIIDIEISEAFPFTISEAEYQIPDDYFENKYIVIDGGRVGKDERETITLQEALEAGSKTTILHNRLRGKEASDQHPITSIRGLSTRLENLEELKTVYSNGRGVAQYYLWEDEPSPEEDRIGFFVSLNPDTNTIKKYTDGEALGVTVDSAAFVGGQDDTPRNYKYGLVAYSGVVDVRCEFDIEAGDFVYPNIRAVAQKSDNNYGFQVLNVNRMPEVAYATIALVASSTQLNELGQTASDIQEDITSLDSRVTAAMNLASDALHYAQNSGGGAAVSAEAIEKSNQALDKANQALNTANKLDGQIQTAIESSEHAAEIAEIAISSAETIRNETLAATEQALTEIAQTKQEIQATRAELIEADDELKDSLYESSQDFIELTGNLSPLTNHVNGGVAGFVARADADSVTLGNLAIKTDGIDKSLAGFMETVKKDYATTTQLAEVDTKNSNAIAQVKTTADTNKATLDAVSSFKYEDDEGNVTEGLAGLRAQVTENASELNLLATFESGDNKGLAGLKAQVTADASELSNIAEHTYVDADGNTLSGLAAINQQVTDQGSTITGLTEWQDTTNNTMTSLQQKSDANGSYIQGLVIDIDKYSYGEYSQAYGFTYEQAQTILTEGQIYVPSKNHSETYKTESEEDDDFVYNFTVGSYYKWDITEAGKLTWAEYAESVSDIPTYIPGTEGSPYWIPSENVEVDGFVYEKDTLYKWQNTVWIAVATLRGNSSSRTTSLVKQTADEISASVTDIKGDVAETKQWVTDNDANIQTVVSWHSDNKTAIATTIEKASANEAYIGQIASIKNDDGTINAAASIIAAVNDDDSSITLNADHINFEGFVSFADKSDVEAVQDASIYDVKVEYALSSSQTVEPTNGWSEKAPGWINGMYMWQRTTITKGDGSILPPTVTCIQGAKGQDAITYRIESSSGTAFAEGQEGQTTLKAHLYEGANEIDVEGNYTYTWYIKNSGDDDIEIGTGKVLLIDISSVSGKGVYFIADDGNGADTSILKRGRLGVLALNKGI